MLTLHFSLIALNVVSVCTLPNNGLHSYAVENFASVSSKQDESKNSLKIIVASGTQEPSKQDVSTMDAHENIQFQTKLNNILNIMELDKRNNDAIFKVMDTFANNDSNAPKQINEGFNHNKVIGDYKFTTHKYGDYILEKKKNNGDGYFSGFLIMLFEIVNQKADSEVKLLCTTLPLELDTLIKQDKFILSFGRDIVELLEKFSSTVANSSPKYVKNRAASLHHTVANRKLLLEPELVNIIHSIDKFYDETEGMELFKALENLNKVLSTPTRTLQVLRTLTGAIFAPYLRLASSYKKQTLINAINRVISRVKANPNGEPADDEDISNAKVDNTKRREVLKERKEDTRHDVRGRNVNKFKQEANIKGDSKNNILNNEEIISTNKHKEESANFNNVNTGKKLLEKSQIQNTYDAFIANSYTNRNRPNVYRQHQNRNKEEIQLKKQINENDKATNDIRKFTTVYNVSDKQNGRHKYKESNKWADVMKDYKSKNNRTVNEISMISSYSDEEESLKLHLRDAMRLNSFRRHNINVKDVERKRNKNVLHEFSSTSSEEVAFKSSIYKGFGFKLME